MTMDEIIENIAMVQGMSYKAVKEEVEKVARELKPEPGPLIELKRNPNFECSKCHRWNKKRTNYCPNCGVKMEVTNDKRRSN